MKQLHYVYSFDCEDFVDDERLSVAKNWQEAKKTARQIMVENDKQEITVAMAYQVETTDIIPPTIGQDVIERINDYIYDVLLGDDSEFINVGTGSEEKLGELVSVTIDNWLTANNLEPQFQFLDEFMTITKEGEI